MLDFSTIDPNTGCGPNPGIVTITAANGDTLVLVLGGDHCQSTPDAPLGVTSGDDTVTGGTVTPLLRRCRMFKLHLDPNSPVDTAFFRTHEP